MIFFQKDKEIQKTIIENKIEHRFRLSIIVWNLILQEIAPSMVA